MRRVQDNAWHKGSRTQHTRASVYVSMISTHSCGQCACGKSALWAAGEMVIFIEMHIVAFDSHVM